MSFVSSRALAAAGALLLAIGVGVASLPARAEEQPAAAPAAAASPAPTKKMKKKHAAQPARSLESRHAVCLAFIQRHGLSCDPWQEPTCGGDLGYFRPPECVRPRSQ